MHAVRVDPRRPYDDGRDPQVQASGARPGNANGGARAHAPTFPPAPGFPPARLVIADPDRSTRNLLTGPLRGAGFVVDAVQTGRGALRRVEDSRPDLVMLEVDLPDVSGFTVAQHVVREHLHVAIMFVTARVDAADRVRGLEVADDYLTKPFAVEEVVARTRAVLRRTVTTATGPRLLTFADVEIDDASREVRRAGRRLGLTPTEYRLLRFLVANANRVVPRPEIYLRVWADPRDGSSGLLDTYISYLRAKVDLIEPHLIHTVRGQGFVVRLPSV
jgi:two-component system, OmpR family, response regulator